VGFGEASLPKIFFFLVVLAGEASTTTRKRSDSWRAGSPPNHPAYATTMIRKIMVTGELDH
jgi:hypothetical protein